MNVRIIQTQATSANLGEAIHDLRPNLVVAVKLIRNTRLGKSQVDGQAVKVQAAIVALLAGNGIHDTAPDARNAH
jgi:hypothetical protein